MTNLVGYTLEKLLIQQAVIERDASLSDWWGGDDGPNWQPHITVACRLWWDKSSGARSANREYVSVSRDVPVSEGGMLLPSGTDVTQADRITQVLDATGNLYITGIFEIVAVLNEQTHMEIDVQRTQLGA